MANLNLSPNLFLEVNELKRFRDGIEKDGYKVFVKYLTKSFGIAQNSNNTFFKVPISLFTLITLSTNILPSYVVSLL